MTLLSRPLLSPLGLTLGLAAFSPASGAQSNGDLPTAYAVGSLQTQNVQRFADDIAKASGGKRKIMLPPNASRYQANEIKGAVQTGQWP